VTERIAIIYNEDEDEDEDEADEEELRLVCD